MMLMRISKQFMQLARLAFVIGNTEWWRTFARCHH